MFQAVLDEILGFAISQFLYLDWKHWNQSSIVLPKK